MGPGSWERQRKQSSTAYSIHPQDISPAAAARQQSLSPYFSFFMRVACRMHLEGEVHANWKQVENKSAASQIPAARASWMQAGCLPVRREPNGNWMRRARELHGRRLQAGCKQEASWMRARGRLDESGMSAGPKLDARSMRAACQSGGS